MRAQHADHCHKQRFLEGSWSVEANNGQVAHISILNSKTQLSSLARITRVGQKMASLEGICVCVIGVGFVGESLLSTFGRVFDCIGFDTSKNRINKLKLEGSFDHLPKNIQLTADATHLARGTHFLIAVPTPVRDDRSVNLDFVVSAIRNVLHHAKKGSSIVIESTVPIGTTREFLGPSRHLFNCGMSPERIDPGRITPTNDKIPKIVSGLTQKALSHISYIYSQVFETIVEVSKPETAEMTKLFENCYRMVNIAYANEMSDACRPHAIDPNEVVKAASTKPFGYQPFWPGLGVGGHCIPVNPYYLFTNNRMPLLEKATNAMQQRPHRMAIRFHQRCTRRLPQSDSGDPPSPLPEPVVPPRILIVGVAFKPGQSEVSGSPAVTFAKELLDIGCERLAFYDPLVDGTKVRGLEKLHKRKWNRAYLNSEFDGIAVCVQQHGIDFKVLRGLINPFIWRFVSVDNDKRNEALTPEKPNMASCEAVSSLGDPISLPVMPMKLFTHGLMTNEYF